MFMYVIDNRFEIDDASAEDASADDASADDASADDASADDASADIPYYRRKSLTIGRSPFIEKHTSLL